MGLGLFRSTLLVLLFLPAQSDARRSAELPDDRFLVRLVAQSFFRSILEGNVKAASPLCDVRVNFDGILVQGHEAVEQRLRTVAARAKRFQLHLQQVVLLSQAEMQQRYGPAPKRLRDVAKKGVYVALARFDRGGAVAMFARRNRFWRMVGLSD
jgi:hypothetical protein